MSRPRGAPWGLARNADDDDAFTAWACGIPTAHIAFYVFTYIVLDSNVYQLWSLYLEKKRARWASIPRQLASEACALFFAKEEQHPILTGRRTLI